MPEFLQFDFMQRALLAGLLVGVACPLVGAFVVARRYALIGDTLAHVSLAGVAAGMLAKAYPLAWALGFSVGAALFIERLRRAFARQGELAIAVVLSSALALAVVLISLGTGGVDLMGYLFGSIITVTAQDLRLVAGLTVVSLLLVGYLYRELFAVTFDEEHARVTGLPVQGVNALFTVLVALTVTLAMRVVGVLLVSSLMVIPVAAAMQIARSFRQAILYSILLGEAAIITGLILSYYLNLAPGGTVVLTAVAMLLLLLPFRRR
jgi:zinc transport system permease protein